MRNFLSKLILHYVITNVYGTRCNGGIRQNRLLKQEEELKRFKEIGLLQLNNHVKTHSFHLKEHLGL